MPNSLGEKHRDSATFQWLEGAEEYLFLRCTCIWKERAKVNETK